jgi:hypothetical protein
MLVLHGRFTSWLCCAGKLLAVALLDCTVKVFFLDSLKFFLSLYGHKLPVSTCIVRQTFSVKLLI